MRAPWLKLFPFSALLLVAWVWSGTLQHEIGAPDNTWFLGDTADFVVAWHVWGVSHPPGYPLLNLIANGLVRLFSALGAMPVLAASLVSYFTNLAAMLVFARLILHVASAQRASLALGWVTALCLLMLAFMNMTWLFASAAEAYGFGLLLGWLTWLLALRLRQTPSARRLFVLAFAFGLAFGHHRTLALMLPALLYLIAPAYRQLRWPVWLIALFFIGLSGVVYAYVPLALLLNSPFTYGITPLNTFDGFRNLILAQERLTELPTEAFTALRLIPDLIGDRFLGLALELSWPGFILSLLALRVGCVAQSRFVRAQSRALLILLLSYLFVPISALLLFSTHLPVMLVSWGLVLAIGLALVNMLEARVSIAANEGHLHPFAMLSFGKANTLLNNGPTLKTAIILAVATIAMLSVTLRNYQQNFQPIRQMLNDPRGRQLIDAIKTIPESNPTFVEVWGGRYAVLAYAKWVSKELDNILLFKVNDELEGLPQRDRLATVIYTTPKTMSIVPPGIWTRKFLLPITLNSPVEGVIAIDHRFYERVPSRRTQIAQFEIEVDQAKAWFTPEGDVRLKIDWHAMQAINTDFRVFVYLSDNPFDIKSESDILARFEQNAPVYGFYPTSRWRDDLRVRDNYRITLPRELNRLPTRAYFGLATSIHGISISQLIRAVPIENQE